MALQGSVTRRARAEEDEESARDSYVRELDEVVVVDRQLRLRHVQLLQVGHRLEHGAAHVCEKGGQSLCVATVAAAVAPPAAFGVVVGDATGREPRLRHLVANVAQAPLDLVALLHLRIKVAL